MSKKFFRILILTVLALSAVYAVAAFAAETDAEAPEPKDPEKVLAKVEGQEIKEKDVDQVLVSAGQQAAMMYDNEQGRKSILEKLIADRLFALSGKKQGLDETPEFKSVVESFVSQNLATAAVDKLVRDITASEEECKKFYDDNPDQFIIPDEIRASHILIADDVASADKIALIQEELKKGVSFDVLAVEHSIDPSAAQGGGDLGFFRKGQMVPEFETTAFELKDPGDISDPIKTNFGWHIIKLEEKRPSSVMPYDDIQPQIAQYLTNEKMTQKYLEELETLKKEYKVEMPVSE